MNIRRIIKDNDELGRSDFSLKPRSPTRRQKQLVVLLIGFFLLIALLADLWPLKNTYFNWNKVGVRAHATLLVNQLDPAMRYVEGGSPDADHSLYYLLAVKFFSIFIHSRLLCLRVLSIVATAISLFFLYRTATILFSRPVALITLFIMVTSPISQRQLYFPPNDNYTSLFLMVNYCHGEGLLLLPPAPLGGRAPIIGCHHLLFSISEPLRSPLLDFIG